MESSDDEVALSLQGPPEGTPAPANAGCPRPEELQQGGSGTQQAALRRERACEELVHLAAEYRSHLSGEHEHEEEKEAAAEEELPEVAAGTAASEVVDGASPQLLEQPTNAVIIFDWDDTLFPTWFVQRVVLPCLPDCGREASIPSDSPFRETLTAHANAVRGVLLAARAVAQVAIVTLAMRPWVLTSSERFLPGLDLAELLPKLDIPVYYAREHVKRPDACLAQLEEGVDVFTVAKRATMVKCLRKLYRKRRNVQMNVISVGDSIAEKDAIKEVLWAASEQSSEETPLCKTVKFLYQPTVEQLGDQLQLLGAWLRRMALHAEDFDLSMEDPEDLRVRGPGLFAEPA